MRSAHATSRQLSGVPCTTSTTVRRGRGSDVGGLARDGGHAVLPPPTLGELHCCLLYTTAPLQPTSERRNQSLVIEPRSRVLFLVRKKASNPWCHVDPAHSSLCLCFLRLSALSAQVPFWRTSRNKDNVSGDRLRRLFKTESIKLH